MAIYLGDVEIGIGVVQNQDNVSLVLKDNGAYTLTIRKN